MAIQTAPALTDAAAQQVDQRFVRALPRLRVHGWDLKVYGIAYQQAEPGQDLVDAARAAAAHALPEPAEGDGRHGVGFLIIHDGALGRWALVFWWSHRILLRERLFHSPTGSPLELRPVTDGLIACIYELQVIEWERQAWLRHVLDGQPDLQAYLDDEITPKPALGWPATAPA